MSTVSKSSSRSSIDWVEVPPGWQDGAGLMPYDGETAHMLDWVENMQGRSAHLFAHRGQLIVDLVEIEPNAVHQIGKPGDEIVVVVNGALQLITDASKVEQTFYEGEMVMFRAGWRGIYRVKSEKGPFRELAIVPHNYFDASTATPASSETPKKIDLPKTVGRCELFRNSYVVESEQVDHAVSRSITAPTDEVIQVLGGHMSLRAGERIGHFEAGSVVVLPRGFIGEMTTSADYRAVTARWNG